MKVWVLVDSDSIGVVRIRVAKDVVSANMIQGWMDDPAVHMCEVEEVDVPKRDVPGQGKL